MAMAEAVANGCRVVSTPVGIAPQVGATATTPERLADLALEAVQRTPMEAGHTPFTAAQTADAYLELYLSTRTAG